ncbi:MAG TPA: hypothetical protein VH637_17205 [Streptosporangiaceae bacterium]|jgi:hypothetical protein
MALIAIAADKGSPGVTTSALALAAVWPRPVLLAECDPAGGDLAFWLPGADGASLDTRRGLLSAALAARRGMAPGQVWEHVQKVHGGLDVLTGVTNAEQGAGLEGLWGSIGTALAGVPQADVIADCGRVGVDGPFYDLLAQATMTVLVSGVSFGEIIRLRERATTLAAGLGRRGRTGARIPVVIIASPRHLNATLTEISHALGKNSPAAIAGGLAHDPRSAESLRGEWGGKLDKSMLIRTARSVAAAVAGQLPPLAGAPAAPPQALPPGAADQGAAAGRGSGPARPALVLEAAPVARDQAPARPGEYAVPAAAQYRPGGDLLARPGAARPGYDTGQARAVPGREHDTGQRPAARTGEYDTGQSRAVRSRDYDTGQSRAAARAGGAGPGSGSLPAAPGWPEPPGGPGWSGAAGHRQPAGYPAQQPPSGGRPAGGDVPSSGGRPARSGRSSRGRHAEPAPDPAGPERPRDDTAVTWPGQAAATPGRPPDTPRDW